MKKNGFTLAEVLITLAIIGVVATLTLPSLMSNTQEQQAVTAFKKAMNTLNEVAQMNAAVDGFDFSGIAVTTAPSNRSVYDNNGALEQSVWGMMASKAQVDVTQSTNGNLGGGCAGMSTVFFRDGTVLCYTADALTNGNQAQFINAVIDTNGRKAPNALSTCGQNDPNCAVKATKAIRDQFNIVLWGSNALPGRIQVQANGNATEVASPENNAARWAMRK